MDNLELEKSSYGPFERFLFIFLIPVLFTLFLILVLLSLVDQNFMNGVLNVANKIPYVKTIVPDPAASPDESGFPVSAPSSSQLVADLKKQLAEKEALISDYEAKRVEKDREIADLKKQLEQLQKEEQQKTQTQEEYRQKIQALANVFARMSPSKAAPIFENLTLQEQVLLLNEMKTDERVRILEKMNPKKAADASILLKDVVPVENLELQALQARLGLYDQRNAEQAEQSQGPSSLSMDELARTVANMAPKDAAAVVIQMYGTNPNNTLKMLRAMDTEARSKLMSSVAQTNFDAAAAILNQLAR